MNAIAESKYRHELKYLVSSAQAEHLKMRMAALLQRDPHAGTGGVYNISSVYFDDHDNRCFYENENGADPREKFRIRIYNHSAERVVLECKRKERGMTLKRSCALTEEQARKLIAGECSACDLAGQPENIRKLSLEMLLHRMRPVIIVDYDRYPFVYPGGNVRITLDTNIASASNASGFFDPMLPKRPVLAKGQQLLEVKYDEYLPDQIYRLLQLDNLRQTAFSKYYICRKYSMGIR